MKVSFGLKAHSGWAALIVLGVENGKWEIIDRRRIELVDEEWAKQPYHAAEELEASEARKVVERGIKAAHKNAKREMTAAIERSEMLGNKVKACGVLVGQPMPGWSADEILAVHFRMHKAEGVLFREALAQAASGCGVKVLRIPEKTLGEYAEEKLDIPRTKLISEIALLGKAAGPPWGKDQKETALAAMIAFGRR
jgi:hypothetical protein